MNSFSNKEIIKKSWNQVKDNLKVFIPIVLISWLIQLISSTIQNSVENTILSLILSILFWVVGTLVTMGLLTIFIKAANQVPVSYKNYLDDKDKFVPYVIGTIYYSLIVFVGLLLLIVPGIIWAIRYQFYGYLIIDQGMSPKDALRKSKEMTKGMTLKLLIFGLILLGVNILGMLALVVGLLVSVPVSMLALAIVYKKLSGDTIDTSTEPSNTSTPNQNNMWATFRQNQ